MQPWASIIVGLNLVNREMYNLGHIFVVWWSLTITKCSIYFRHFTELDLAQGVNVWMSRSEVCQPPYFIAVAKSVLKCSWCGAVEWSNAAVVASARCGVELGWVMLAWPATSWVWHHTPHTQCTNNKCRISRNITILWEIYRPILC